MVPQNLCLKNFSKTSTFTREPFNNAFVMWEEGVDWVEIIEGGGEGWRVGSISKEVVGRQEEKGLHAGLEEGLGFKVISQSSLSVAERKCFCGVLW